MKKIMVAAAAAMLGIAAYAVPANWNSGVVEYSGVALDEESTMYVFYFNKDDTAYNSLLSAWNNGTGEDMTKLVWNQYGSSLGDAKSTTFTAGEAYVTVEADKKFDVYAAIILTHSDNTGAVDAYMGNIGSMYVGTGGGDALDLGLTVLGYDDAGEHLTPTEWVAASTPTPEPTPTPTPTPVPKPNITKNPTGETVDAGGSAIFIAKADGCEKYEWHFLSADGSKDLTRAQAVTYFTGLNVSGENTNTLTLGSIPSTMDGWRVCCHFSNQGGEVVSQTAIVSVRKVTASPIITQQPKAINAAVGEKVTLSIRAVSPDGGTLRYQWYRSANGVSGSAVAISGADKNTYTVESTEGVAYYSCAVTNSSGGNASPYVLSDQVAVSFTKPSPTPAPHEHSFSAEWSYTDTVHYKLCSCGEHSEEAAHEFTWTVEKAAKRRSEGLRRGVCERCGFEKTETIPATGSGNARSRALLVVLGLLALLTVAVAAFLILRISGKLTVGGEDAEEDFDEEEYPEGDYTEEDFYPESSEDDDEP